MNYFISKIKNHFKGRVSRIKFRSYTINFLKNYFIIAILSFLLAFTIKSILPVFSIYLAQVPTSFDLAILFTNLLILPIYILSSLSFIARRFQDFGVNGYYSLLLIFLFLFAMHWCLKLGTSSLIVIPLPFFICFTTLSLIKGNNFKNKYGIPETTQPRNLY